MFSAMHDKEGLKMKIELDSPNLGELEKKYLCDCIDSNYVSTIGPYVTKFEEQFAAYIDVVRAVSVQSGTASLHAALIEFGIGEGDEVIVPALTFVATVNPVRYVGATPVFVDVDPNTWNIDPHEIEKAITPKTKAVLPVHLYGNPCDMKSIMEIANKHNLIVIEDATESLGATFGGRQTGTFGDAGCFSFNGNKVITTGGGGMVVTKAVERAEHIKFIVNQARDASKGFYHTEIGYNMRMTNLEASIGLAQMERLSDFLSQKKKFNQIYREVLADIPFVHFQNEYENGRSAWWLSSVVINHTSKDIAAIQQELREKDIPTRRLFVPVTEFPPYKKYATGNYYNTMSLYNNGLCLPSSTLNDIDSIYCVAEKLKDICNV